jgi:hypothetical protein
VEKSIGFRLFLCGTADWTQGPVITR